MLSRSSAESRRKWRLARLVITKPHVMAKLVEGHEIAAPKFAAAFGDCVAVAGFRLFFQLPDQGPRGAVLHRRRQLAQTFNGFVEQFGHAVSITSGCTRLGIDKRRKTFRKKNIVRTNLLRP